ncbi:MAG: hypothetical protein AAGA56_17360 [Myxococcota bacterium]
MVKHFNAIFDHGVTPLAGEDVTALDPSSIPYDALPEPLMSTGQTVLVSVALLIIAYRIYLGVRGKGGAADEDYTYPEPTLLLEEKLENEHETEVFGELESTLDVDHAAEGRYLDAKEGETTWLRVRLFWLFTIDLWSIPVTSKVFTVGGALLLLVLVPYASHRLAFLQVLPEGAGQATAALPPLEDAAAVAAGGPLPSASVGEASLPGETMDSQARGRELDGPGPGAARGPIAQGKVKMPPAVNEKKPPRQIEDASDKALDKFFAKLVQVENKEAGAQARILYYGDSIVASDFVSGKLRRKMQTRFGDAGHGYAIIANAWPGWFHIDVSRKASANWGVSTCVGPYAEDARYGLGCASFNARGANAWTEFGTSDPEISKWGRSVSRFEIEYLRQPGGGAFDLIVDGTPKGRLETDGETAVAWHPVEVPDGPHTLRVESVDDRPSRIFGIRMDREAPGVQLSAMGVTGARARFLDKQDDEHWKKVLAHTEADLVCLAFGSNEITDGNMYPMDKYEETLEKVMIQVEEALPNASLMLVGPPDMASAKASQGHSRPMVFYIVKHQKILAEKRGWAHWDQFRAMGGGGTMWQWMKTGLGNQDMFHPTGKGGNVLGRWLYYALMEKYEAYKAKRRD